LNEEHEIEITVSLKTGRVHERLLVRNERGVYSTSVSLDDSQIPPSLRKKVTQLQSFLKNITPEEEEKD